jgi:tetratricopeptide (TPR) repeat protein
LSGAKYQVMNTTPQSAPGLSIDQALAQAHAHWDAGQNIPAEMLCQQVLAVWPGQSDALHLLGLMAYAFGNVDLAIDNLRRACQAPRVAPVYLSNLAEMCRQRGLLAEGEEAARRAVGLEPTLVGAWNNLGIIQQEAGKLEESLASLTRVVGLKPDDALARNNLGNTLKRLGRLDEARQQYEAALALMPNYAEAHSNLGSLLNDLGRSDEALASIRRAMDINPRLADAYINASGVETARRRYDDALRWIDGLLSFAPLHPGGLAAKASVLVSMERPDQAVDVALQAVSAAPQSGDALLALGEALHAQGQLDQALLAFDKAIALGGLTVEKAMINRASVKTEQGDKEAALADLKAVIERFPNSASAWLPLSDMKKFKAADPDIARMERLAGPGVLLARSEATAVRFALGKAWMDAGDAERAFEHLNEGNRMMRETFAYDADETSRWIASIGQALDAKTFKRLSGGGAPSDAPVFVIGVPRSGTTLLEQILASHAAVHGAGELSAMRTLTDAYGGPAALVSALTPDVATQIGRDYLAEIAKLGGGKARVVDKMPSNFLLAGLIPLVLPGAHIIHVKRDPVDTCLSCYSKLFAREQLFTYDLTELGRFYRDYEAIMAHWRKVLPADRFLEVQYEAVVDDLEGQARRMIEFIGLPWDDAVLDFHKTKRRVRTASVNQVRQPLFNTSVGRWKPFAKQLRPLTDALGLLEP